MHSFRLQWLSAVRLRTEFQTKGREIFDMAFYIVGCSPDFPELKEQRNLDNPVPLPKRCVIYVPSGMTNGAISCPEVTTREGC